MPALHTLDDERVACNCPELSFSDGLVLDKWLGGGLATPEHFTNTG